MTDEKKDQITIRLMKNRVVGFIQDMKDKMHVMSVSSCGGFECVFNQESIDIDWPKVMPKKNIIPISFPMYRVYCYDENYEEFHLGFEIEGATNDKDWRLESWLAYKAYHKKEWPSQEMPNIIIIGFDGVELKAEEEQ